MIIKMNIMSNDTHRPFFVTIISLVRFWKRIHKSENTKSQFNSSDCDYDEYRASEWENHLDRLMWHKDFDQYLDYGSDHRLLSPL